MPLYIHITSLRDVCLSLYCHDMFRLGIFPEGELKQRLLTCGEKDGLSVDDLNTMAEKVAVQH